MSAVVIFLALAGLLAIALGAAILRLLAVDGRVRRLRAGIEQIRSGNLAHRVVLRGNDELAHLADDVNALAERLQGEREDERRRDLAHKQLISNISHDLRTPITSIAGYVDALERGLGDDPKRHIAVLSAKTAELTALTEDLFFMSKLDSGDLELQAEQFDMGELVRQTLLGFEQELVAREVQVETKIPEVECLVVADETAVRRVLTNLIGNSLKHAKGMTNFHVAVSREADRCVVEIRDDGAGFTKRVGELVERGAKAGPGGGSGLGLSIAHDLAERMGAVVRVDSEPGQGTRVRIEFGERTES